jgi:hypothetical protein
MIDILYYPGDEIKRMPAISEFPQQYRQRDPAST